jgi:hypothetical protein
MDNKYMFEITISDDKTGETKNTTVSLNANDIILLKKYLDVYIINLVMSW